MAFGDLSQEKRTKWAFFLASICAIVVFVLLQFLLTCGMLQVLVPGTNPVANLPAYVMTLALFVMVFCVFLLFFCRLPMSKTAAFMEKPIEKKTYMGMFVAGSAGLLILLAIRRLYTETTEFSINTSRMMYHQFPDWIGIPLFFAVAAVAVAFGVKLQKGRDISNRLLYVGALGVLLLNFMAVLVLDIFRADIHHGVAYTESIYNVFYGVPYTHITTGIYGFHGLFLAPVLHLFGGSNLALVITIALLETLVVVLCAYCIWTLVEENYFRLFALLMCCLSTLTIRSSNYWQVQPHRILWPLILIAFILHLVKKNRWRRRDQFLGYCICTAAVLWNVESGLFCGIAFAASCMVHDWQQNLWSTPQSLLKLLRHIVAVIVTVAVAILIVNGYNYLCGWRQWILRYFFFPMFVDSYVTDSLEVDMPIGNHAWVYVLVLFGSLLLCTLYMTSFVRGKAGVRAKNTTKFAPAMMAVAMLGLCSFSYYANRAAYANLDIVMQLAGIAACMVWRAFRQNLFCRSGTRETCVKTIVAYVSLVLAMVLAIEAAVFSTPLLLRKYKYKHYDRSNYNQACAWLEESIPANTFAFGGGISWLYADLGWDTIGHYRDMSDMSVGGGAVKNTIVRDALSQDSFVAYLSTGREKEIVEQILMEAPEFVLIEETELNRKVLQYYVRSGDKGE